MTNSILMQDILIPMQLPTKTPPGDVEYILPGHIALSSVGDYYAENMKQFIHVAHAVKRHLESYVTGRDICDYLFKSLLPLGTIRPTPLFSNVLTPEYRTKFMNALLYPIKNQDLEDYALPRLYPGGTGVALLADLKENQSKIEQLAQRVCTGYTPLRTGLLTVLQNNEHFIKEYMSANVLYPWVMQPMNQLRMLIPALSDGTVKALLHPYDTQEVIHPGLDYGCALNYEFVTDFQGYMDIRRLVTAYPTRVTRQMWTPFFGITHAELYSTYIKDVDLLAQVFKCFDQSKKLYVEMLKTGLAYEAQYAVLQGFAGRFIISGNFSGILDLRQESNFTSCGISGKNILSNISETPLLNSIYPLEGEYGRVSKTWLSVEDWLA